MPIQDINRDKKFHPVRYYVVDSKEARILINHATVTWLDIVKVLCNNKAPKIKKQVASDSNKNISHSGPTHLPKVKYLLAASPHLPKLKYSQIIMEKQ